MEHETSVNDDATYYEPIVEYVTPTGERRRLKYGAAFPQPRAVDGSERRGVWDDPTDPEKSYVELKLRSSLPIPLPVIFLLPFAGLAIGFALRLAH